MTATEASETTKKQSASYVIFRDILRGVYEGRYVPGQRLVETDLVTEYSATRFVIKDAIKLLVSEGVAINNFYRSCHIPRLSRDEARHIFEVMETLFSLAARQAAAAEINAEHVESLKAAADGLLAVNGDEEFFEFGRASSRYFRTVVKASGNTELMRMLPNLRFHLIRAQFKAYPAAAESRNIAALRGAIDAILAKDADMSERMILTHFRNMAAAVASLPDRAFSNK